MIRTTALIACLLLSACGQKGNLYLPDESKPVVVPAQPMASPLPATVADPATAPTDEEQRRRQQQQQQQTTPATTPAPTNNNAN